MQKIVILTGAGISAESGIKTFRDEDGLWEGFDVMEVATPQGWKKNPALVLDFYNQRRKQVNTAKPNLAHTEIVKLEKKFKTIIITQNVDDLHERAGSKKVIHLHGELKKSRSTKDDNLVYPIKGWQLNIGDFCEKGSQLRPDIVWFGEQVPLIETAQDHVAECDILIIIGTSMLVYPAAGLINYTKSKTKIFVIDPNIPNINQKENVTLIAENATTGVSKLVNQLINE